MVLLDRFIEIPELLQLVIEELLDLEHVFAEVPLDGVYTCPELSVSLLCKLGEDLKVNFHGLLSLELSYRLAN